MSLWGNRDYFKDHFWMIEGGLFGGEDCLIASGALLNSTFFRSGDVVYDGSTYGVNTPISVGGRYVSHGTFEDLAPTIDIFLGSAQSGTVDLGAVINIMGYDVTKFSIGTSGFSGHSTVITSAGWSAVTYWIWSNMAGAIDIWGGSPTTTGVLRVNLVAGMNEFSHNHFETGSIARSILIDNRATATPGLEIAAIAQMTMTEYPITPIYIPTSLTSPGAPASIDTCASAPNPDKHGANWEFSDPRNKGIWDLLDGVADGENLWTNIFINESGLAKGTDNGDGTYTIESPNGDGVSIEARAVLDLGSRYEAKIYVNDISGSGEARFSGAAAPQNVFSVGGSHVYRSEAGGINFFVVRVGICDFTFSVSLKQISPALGTLTLKSLSIVPTKTEWQTIGDFNILSGATGNQILYIEETTGLICATDGTNTSKSLTEYVAGTDHLVSMVFGDDKMQIIVDGVKGGIVPFVGTFSPGETLKWAFENEDIFSIASVCGSTTSTFEEAVDLAEDLAMDL